MPHALQRTLLVLAVVILVFVVVRDPVFQPSTGFDYCAAANLRTCKVVDHGDWTLVVGSDNHQVLILMKDGRVYQTLQ